MVTKKIITLFAVIVLPLQLFSQNKYDNPVSISFQVGYLLPQSTDGPSQSLKGGIELKPSVYKRISPSLTALFDFIYSEHKYKTGDDRGLRIYRLINFGFRIYPRTPERFYLKPSIGYSLDENYSSFPGLNFGVGNDFRISKNIDLLGEAEIFFRLFDSSAISFSISGGIKYNFF